MGDLKQETCRKQPVLGELRAARGGRLPGLRDDVGGARAARAGPAKHTHVYIYIYIHICCIYIYIYIYVVLVYTHAHVYNMT